MRARAMTFGEYRALKDRSGPDGIPYKDILPTLDSGLIETTVVIEGDSGERIAAAVAIRTVEIVLIMEWGAHPIVKQTAIGKIHDELRTLLVPKGYSRAFAVVPPMLQGYVRNMIRRFGWRRDYPAYRIE